MKFLALALITAASSFSFASCYCVTQDNHVVAIHAGDNQPVQYFNENDYSACNLWIATSNKCTGNVSVEELAAPQ